MFVVIFNLIEKPYVVKFAVVSNVTRVAGLGKEDWVNQKGEFLCAVYFEKSSSADVISCYLNTHL